MNHHLLDQHQTIAFDIDGTLINGPNSKFLCSYIASNPNKTYHLVTFRDQEWAEQVYGELSATGLYKIHFKSLNSCPQHLYRAHTFQKQIMNPIEVQEYLEWKGMISSKLGCTALVDDMPNWVVQGCSKYNVEFIDALSEEFSI